CSSLCLFFPAPATTQIYTLSLHDALPISRFGRGVRAVESRARIPFEEAPAMHLTSTFLRGLGVVLPIALTLYLVVWTLRAAEALMRPLTLLLLPSNVAYVSGSGLALAVVLVYLTGLLVQLFVFEWMVGLSQRVLERTPLVKSIYNAANDFMGYFARRPSEAASRVVNVKLAEDLSIVGFITDPDPAALRAPEDPVDR